jgi:hypothetical protein
MSPAAGVPTHPPNIMHIGTLCTRLHGCYFGTARYAHNLVSDCAHNLGSTRPFRDPHMWVAEDYDHGVQKTD